jgi:hypothetical protein
MAVFDDYITATINWHPAPSHNPIASPRSKQSKHVRARPSRSVSAIHRRSIVADIQPIHRIKEIGRYLSAYVASS